MKDKDSFNIDVNIGVEGVSNSRMLSYHVISCNETNSLKKKLNYLKKDQQCIK